MLAGAILLFALAQGPCQAAAPVAAPATTPAPAVAATPPGSPVSAQPPAAPGEVRVAAGTVLQVELVDELSSTTSKLGDKFAIRLAEPITVDGVVVVPAGAVGQGEVIDAAHGGMAGTPGKLIVAARYLVLNGQQVRVRGMTLMVAGENRNGLSQTVMLIPYVGGLSTMFVKGGEIWMPAGTHATVKVAQDTNLAAASTPSATGNTQ